MYLNFNLIRNSLTRFNLQNKNLCIFFRKICNYPAKRFEMLEWFLKYLL